MNTKDGTLCNRNSTIIEDIKNFTYAGSVKSVGEGANKDIVSSIRKATEIFDQIKPIRHISTANKTPIIYQQYKIISRLPQKQCVAQSKFCSLFFPPTLKLLSDAISYSYYEYVFQLGCFPGFQYLV